MNVAIFERMLAKRLCKANILSILYSLLASTSASSQWNPPPNANPDAIFDEAIADAAAGRFDDALAKHVWFHQNALKTKPSLSGVRRSYALASWRDLGKRFPLALKALLRAREEAEKEALASKEQAGDHFADLVAIDHYLGQEKATVATFELLDKQAPIAAKASYFAAQQALIDAKRFELCGKYMQGEASYRRLCRRFEEMEKVPHDALRFADVHAKLSQDWFLKEAANLVALLVINNRKNEAETISSDARNRSNHTERNKVLDEAMCGLPPKEISSIKRME